MEGGLDGCPMGKQYEGSHKALAAPNRSPLMTRATNARIAGATFLVYIAAGMTTLVLHGRATGGADIAARLASIPQELTLLRISMITGMLSAFSAIVLATTLYGLTRIADRELALFGFACRAGEGIVGMSTIPALGVIWLATQNTSAAAGSDAAHMLAAFLFRMDGWTASVAALLFAAGSTSFAVAFLRGRQLPRMLAWLGVAASILLTVLLPVQIAGWIGGTVAFMIMWMPMLVFEIWLAVWLIVTGAPLAAAPAS